MTPREELDRAQEDWRLARDSSVLAQINMGAAMRSKQSIVNSLQDVAKFTSIAAEREYQAIIAQHREELLAALKRLDETGKTLMALLGRDFSD